MFIIPRLTKGVGPSIVLLDSLQQQAFYIGSNDVATKAKKSTSKKTTTADTTPTVTHIKAIETKGSKAAALTASSKRRTSKKPTLKAKSLLRPLVAMGTYFKGAWYELRQVRWPNRKETWGLTAAVLIFSAFFIILIVLLDALFKFLFEVILK